MKNRTSAVVAASLSLPLLLAGCGGSKSDTTANAPADNVSAGSTAGSTEAASACPTEANGKFLKTRFVADVGLAAGSFHRWIYKPYTEGKFAKGADGRTMAIAKAVGTAALDAKLINNAYDNVKNDPTLCKVLIGPMGALKNQVNKLKGAVTSGDLASIAATNSVLSQVTSASASHGAPIAETTDESQAG